MEVEEMQGALLLLLLRPGAGSVAEAGRVTGSASCCCTATTRSHRSSSRPFSTSPPSASNPPTLQVWLDVDYERVMRSPGSDEWQRIVFLD